MEQIETSSNLHQVFVYGQLMCNHKITELRLQLHNREREATLAGFRRHAIKGFPFPCVVASPEASVAGEILTLTWSDMESLDEYEGVEQGLMERTKQLVKTS